MEPTSRRLRRPARVSRWVASGVTAAVAVGSVGAMAEAAEQELDEVSGSAIGATAAWRAEVAAAEMMAAADPGDVTPIPPPPQIGRAGAS